MIISLSILQLTHSYNYLDKILNLRLRYLLNSLVPGISSEFAVFQFHLLENKFPNLVNTHFLPFVCY